jgi:cell wall-associated NlpC family hydrolase
MTFELPGAGGRGTVAVLLADVHERDSRSSTVIERIPAGTRPPQSYRAAQLGEPYRRPEWAEVPLRGTSASAPRLGFLAVADTVAEDEMPQRFPTADDYLKTAEAFIGVPYLWGGTTALGIDCSGFVQQVYRLNGVALPRDADQQAVLGRKVDEAQAGDLMFFGDESVTHVALATSAREFIHAPMKGAIVERGQLGGDRTLRVIRRYLPDRSDV